MFNDNDRGQVGIGTLIVFIAMVLVAAIAAGVLINTAGLLQSQAEATGEESSEQVTDRVLVQSVSGTAQADDEIDEIRLTVQRSPGAGDINLENVILEVFANGESGTLTNEDPEDEGASAADEFEIDNFGLETDFVLADSADRAALVFELEGSLGEADARLAPGESVSISITTAAGGTAFVEKRAPSSLEDGETYRL